MIVREVPAPFMPAMSFALWANAKTCTRRVKRTYRLGDRLWVREAWRVLKGYDPLPPRQLPVDTVVWYEGDGPLSEPHSWGRYRPPMFMPKWASRMTLEVTGERQERLQAITPTDAVAEGIYHWLAWLATDRAVTEAGVRQMFERYGTGPCAVYAALWDSLHPKPGFTWADNPEIWVYDFRRVRP